MKAGKEQFRSPYLVSRAILFRFLLARINIM